MLTHGHISLYQQTGRKRCPSEGPSRGQPPLSRMNIVGQRWDNTTIGKIPVGTVFRYRPDQTGRGPRVKVADDVCCTLPAWQAHTPMTTEAIDSVLRTRGSGFHYCESDTRVKVIHSEQPET